MVTNKKQMKAAAMSIIYDIDFVMGTYNTGRIARQQRTKVFFFFLTSKSR